MGDGFVEVVGAFAEATGGFRGPWRGLVRSGADPRDPNCAGSAEGNPEVAPRGAAIRGGAVGWGVGGRRDGGNSGMWLRSDARIREYGRSLLPGIMEYGSELFAGIIDCGRDTISNARWAAEKARNVLSILW